jgi:hypothetical protein
MTKRNLEQHTQGPGALLHQAPERAHQTPGRRWRGGWRLGLAMALAPLAWMAPAQAQQILYPTPSEPNAIMVTGVGFAKSKPDSAELFFDAHARRPTQSCAPAQTQANDRCAAGAGGGGYRRCWGGSQCH